MTDYIEKNSVIELIDDAIRNCKWHVAECTINTDDRDLKTLREKVKAIPAADVVEVVRCKDCADFRPWGGQSKLGDCMVYVCDGENPFTMEETDFCSDGEQRS